MAEYLIQGTTLTGIADAIREKLDMENAIFPEDMPACIRSITTEASDTAGIPEDIVAEAKRVTEAMLGKMGTNTLTFLAMADMHLPGDGDIADETVAERYRRSSRNAGQAARLISDRVALDLFANLGDLAFGSSATTVAGGTQAIRAALLDTGAVMDGTASLCTPGNHDPLTYSYAQNGEYLSADTVAGLIGTYGCLDLEEKKVRVICLNTADNSGAEVTAGGTERISGEQLRWFAESLDLSEKDDAAQWRILILAHHPLDWGAVRVAGNCLAAYLEGGAYSITHNGVDVAYDFAGKNMAGVIGQFHGHTHCFKVDYIHDFRSESPVATAVRRIAIPNVCFYRNNEYGTTETYGLVFGEETTYDKTDDSTGKNTAFCLVSIDLDGKVIYADCFGAGYDRVISFDIEEVTTYRVTSKLMNAQTSNAAVTVAAGAAYNATITANSGYTLESVTVTMGGVDVTASVYSGGQITIDSVTGDIVVTAAAVAASDGGDGDDGESVNTSNLGQIAEAIDSTDIYNDGLGYKNGYYLSGEYPFEGTDSATVLTGFIPYDVPDSGRPGTICIRGAQWQALSHCRLYFFTADKSKICGPAITGTGSNLAALGAHYTVETLGDSGYRLTPILDTDSAEGNWVTVGQVGSVTDAAYFRMSLVGTGEDLIITVEETADTGGGGDSGGADTGNYTNLVSASVDTDGSIYNGTGYKTGYRLNSSGLETELSDGIVSGFIPYSGQVIRVRTSGGVVATQSGNYLAMYDDKFTKIYSAAFSGLVSNGAVFEETGDGCCVLTVDPTAITNATYQGYLTSAAYIRCSFCPVGAASDLVVTLDEPI